MVFFDLFILTMILMSTNMEAVGESGNQEGDSGGEPYMPSPDEIKAECAQIQSEWTIDERLSRGRIRHSTRKQSAYLFDKKKLNEEARERHKNKKKGKSKDIVD